MELPPESSPGYRSYLLRLWQRHGTGLAGPWEWRASIERPVTHETHHFDGLRSLFSFLLAEVGEPGAPDGPEPPPGTVG